MKRTVLSLACAIVVGFAPISATAESDAGSYLAARQAVLDYDFAAAARYHEKALLADPQNTLLMDRAVTSLLGLGAIDRATPISAQMIDAGAGNQFSHLVALLTAAEGENWEQIEDNFESGMAVGPLVDALAVAWAKYGAGDVSAALEAFETVARTDGMGVYGLTHKAYALAAMGDFETAADILATNGMRYSRQSAMAHAQILSQLDQNDDAVSLIEQVFGPNRDPGVEALYFRLVDGENVPYSAVRTPQQGLSDLFYVIADLVRGEAQDDFTLIYAQSARALWPENTPAVLMAAELLDALGQADLANGAYASVPRDDPAFHTAELGRAEVLQNAGRKDAAIEVLDALARSYPDSAQVFVAKADALREAERLDGAVEAYTRALDLATPESGLRWFIHYARAISYHRLDEWPLAETDFRSALELRPDHPQILNYLGYSLVERGEKLDEALGMIETAAAARPDNGAIVDSLGWVYFQLGRFEEAVVQLERAASLEPVDPVINDHLGDAFWAVGRETEARFQWHRALSFNPTDEEATRIRDKLQRGLDLVLLDEGRAPIRLASDDR